MATRTQPQNGKKRQFADRQIAVGAGGDVHRTLTDADRSLSGAGQFLRLFFSETGFY